VSLGDVTTPQLSEAGMIPELAIDGDGDMVTCIG
jgi:uncharacterized protein (UPF0218 family)